HAPVTQASAQPGPSHTAGGERGISNLVAGLNRHMRLGTVAGSGNSRVALCLGPDLKQVASNGLALYALRSSDRGRTWSLPSRLSESDAAGSVRDEPPSLVRLPDDSLLAAWSSSTSLGGTIGGEGDIFVSRSTDAGKSWTDPHPLDSNAALDHSADHH